MKNFSKLFSIFIFLFCATSFAMEQKLSVNTTDKKEIVEQKNQPKLTENLREGIINSIEKKMIKGTDFTSLIYQATCTFDYDILPFLNYEYEATLNEPYTIRSNFINLSSNSVAYVIKENNHYFLKIIRLENPQINRRIPINFEATEEMQQYDSFQLYNHEDNTIILSDPNSKIRILNLDTGEQIYGFDTDLVDCDSITKLPGNKLAISCMNIIEIWEFGKNYSKIIHTLEHSNDHLNTIFATCYLGNNILVSGSLDHTIKFWNIEDVKMLNSIDTGHPVLQIEKLSDTKIVSLQTNSIKIWDLTNKTLILHIPIPVFEVESFNLNKIQILANDRILFASSHDNSCVVCIWDINGKFLRKFSSPLNANENFSIDTLRLPKGKFLVQSALHQIKIFKDQAEEIKNAELPKHKPSYCTRLTNWVNNHVVTTTTLCSAGAFALALACKII